MALAEWIGVWGGVLASVTVVFLTWDHLRDRIALAFHVRPYGGLLVFTVTNVGRRPVTISEFGLMERGGRVPSVYGSQIPFSPPDFTLKLSEGEAVSGHKSVNYIAKQRRYFARKLDRPYAITSTGKYIVGQLPAAVLEHLDSVSAEAALTGTDRGDVEPRS